MRMGYTKKKKRLVWSFVVRPAVQTSQLKGRVKNPAVRGHCLNMQTTVHIFKRSLLKHIRCTCLFTWKLTKMVA